jgi:hypothetical protein
VSPVWQEQLAHPVLLRNIKIQPVRKGESKNKAKQEREEKDEREGNGKKPQSIQNPPQVRSLSIIGKIYLVI